MKTKAAWLAKC